MIEGRFYAPGSGRPVTARLVREGRSLRVLTDTGEDVLIEAARGGARVSGRVANIPREIRFASGVVFETRDNDAVDRELAPPTAKLIPWLERFHPRLAAITLGALAVFAIFIGAGVPVLTRAAVSATPYAVEDVLAESILASLEAGALGETLAPSGRRASIEESFARLAEAYAQRDDAREGPRFELLFRTAPAIGPNAFALPGGRIVVTDELLRLVPDDDAVAAVLAHEMAHVHFRHSLYGLYRAAGLSGLVLFVGGDLTQVTEEAVVQGVVLSNLASSRAMERQADLMSVELSTAAGIDPAKLLVALETLEESCVDCPAASWFSTHPGGRDRARRIRRAIKQR